MKKRFDDVTLVKQAFNLKSQFPDSEYKILNRNLLVWEGWVQPRSDGRKYLLCMNYDWSSHPCIWIVDPAHYLEEKRYTHTYSGNQLCLYLPKEWRWRKYEWVSQTIIPWACMWLYYFEIEEITGVWLGGGEHPGKDDEQESDLSDKKFYKLKKRKKPKKKTAPKCIRLAEITS